MKRSLFLLAAALPALAGAPGSAQTRDEGDLQTLTVLRVDPAANEIVVRETGSTRNRTLELDERTAVFGGALGGRMTLQDLEPGDTIRVPGVAGSVSDRVRAEEIQILTTPRDPGAAAPGMRRSDDRPGQRPSAMDPPDGDPGALGRDPIGQPGALGRDPIDQPGALGDDPGTAPGALGTDGRTEPGRVGADPGASDQDSRGTGSPTTPRPRPGDAGTGGGGSGGRGGSSSGGSGGSGGGSGGSGGGGGGR